MQQVLNNEEFDRWQRLLLQRTLDQMADIIYCPKCSIPIIIDQNNTHSFCLNCNLDYCKLCKAQWHPVS
jgi:E3 ubiquitin-protein ligase RNF14